MSIELELVVQLVDDDSRSIDPLCTDDRRYFDDLDDYYAFRHRFPSIPIATESDWSKRESRTPAEYAALIARPDEEWFAEGWYHVMRQMAGLEPKRRVRHSLTKMHELIPERYLRDDRIASFIGDAMELPCPQCRGRYHAYRWLASGGATEETPELHFRRSS